MPETSISLMDVFTVHIKSLAFGGYGVCRINGKVCFVPYGLPGDELLIQVVKESKGVLWGKILDILKESEHRFDPICTSFGECGGCHWLNLDYNEQLKWKKQIVDDSLSRIGKIEQPSTESITRGLSIFAYRTRAKFHFRYEKDDFYLGFYKYKSKDLVDVKVCPLLEGGINDLIYPLREKLKNLSALNFTGEIEITRNPVTKDTLAFLKLDKRDRQSYGELAASLEEMGEITAVDYPGNPSDKVAFDIAVKNVKAWVPPGAFSQSSFENNQKLVDLIVESAGDVMGKNVVDIYSGWGNLSLPLADQGAIVTGFDSDADAVDAANLTAFDNRLKTAKYEKIRDDKLQSHLAELNKAVDMVILDPPRVGAKAIVSEIARGNAERILYVSCNPNTLARDLKIMGEHGRKLEKSYVLDMIPHTYHIETVNVIR